MKKDSEKMIRDSFVQIAALRWSLSAIPREIIALDASAHSILI